MTEFTLAHLQLCTCTRAYACTIKLVYAQTIEQPGTACAARWPWGTARTAHADAVRKRSQRLASHRNDNRTSAQA